MWSMQTSDLHACFYHRQLNSILYNFYINWYGNIGQRTTSYWSFQHVRTDYFHFHISLSNYTSKRKIQLKHKIINIHVMLLTGHQHTLCSFSTVHSTILRRQFLIPAINIAIAYVQAYNIHVRTYVPCARYTTQNVVAVYTTHFNIKKIAHW